MQTIHDLRSLFLDFFQKHNHHHVKSSSLVPANDPSLMFTAAGMVQFKDMFLGKESRKYNRATSSQKCVRAGGKHNDLENVGHTARHLTFFEMLGNFSFGDYFKEEAIKYAWDFVTNEMGISKNKLYITVFHDDHDSFDFWKKITNFDDSKIIKIATNDNFWTMGDTGPCGPCSEIFYDQGDKIFGGLPGTKDENGDRYIEIWNLVFMQYELLKNGRKETLVNRSVDTGMGLERAAAVMQGVTSNFETDLFKNIINAIESFTSTKSENKVPYNVIADHLRSSSFLIADGIMPSNEGRGYVLRRILRRAVRYINNIGYHEPLLHKLLPTLVGEMGSTYPELISNEQMISKILQSEEEVFLNTLSRGLKILNEEKSKVISANKIFSGDAAFKLHDTYGFPIDLTQDILKDNNIVVDTNRFKELMDKQKELAKKSWVGSGDSAVKDLWFEIKNKYGSSEFLGYETTNAKGEILALIQKDKEEKEINNDTEFFMVTNQTPFYGESGGQMGDIGEIKVNGKMITVLNTYKPLPSLHVHLCKINDAVSIKLGDTVDLIVNKEYREGLKRNHTATHLLHSLLRIVLGDHVVQKGSLVAADKLRFDFSYTDSVSRETLDYIEKEVNKIILKNLQVTTKMQKYDFAIEEGAMALFGEKYDDEVRVVSIAEGTFMHSIELCGGTHVERLGDIGAFKIINESSIASGIRRIEAITGLEVIEYSQNNSNILSKLSLELCTAENDLTDKVKEVTSQKKYLEKEIEKLKHQNLNSILENVKVEKISNTNIIFENLSNVPMGDLRRIIQQYISRNHQSIVMISSSFGESKMGVICAVGKEIQPKIKANVVVEEIKADIKGNGGGNHVIAQAVGDKNIEALKNAKIRLIESLDG